MLPLVERLKNNEILISDGAMGTSLHAAGLEPGDLPESWNISNPDAVRKIHEGFIAAGSDMVATNTFGANLIKLKKAGLENKFEELNKKAVGIARKAAGKNVYVLGDIGPTGEFLKPAGNCSEQEFYEVFSKQAKILASSGVDAFTIETISALDELKPAILACKALGLPVIASMTFNVTKKGYRTMAGISIDALVKEMISLKCDCFGANCGCGSRQMVEIMGEMRKTAGKNAFLIAQPNAGMPRLAEGETIFDESAADFYSSVKELMKIGVNIIGGCCGTTPEHIRQIKKAVKG